MKDILDDFNEEFIPTKKIVFLVILFSLGLACILILSKLLTDYLPRYIYDNNEVRISTLGLVIIVCITSFPIMLTKKLNNLIPNQHETVISLLVSISMFFGEIVYFSVYNSFLSDQYSQIDLRGIIQVATIVGTVGGLISFLRIYKLRGKKTYLPLILLFGFSLFLIWMLSQ